MADEATRSRNPAGHAGLLDNLLAPLSGLAVFFESRVALFVRESRAALMQLLVLAVCLMAAIMLCAVTYVFLIASAIVAVARAAGVSWLWLALPVAGVHFLIGLVFFLIARRKMTKRLFPAIAAELKKDREWLKNLDTTGRPRD